MEDKQDLLNFKEISAGTPLAYVAPETVADYEVYNDYHPAARDIF